jgi:Ribosomal protein S21e
MENDQVSLGLTHTYQWRIHCRLTGCSRRSLCSPQVLSNQCVQSILEHQKLWSNTMLVDRLITSKDHASVQISIVDVDANGKALNTSTTFALCGPVRSQGESDDSINRLATKAGRQCFPLYFIIISAEAP